MDKHPIQIERDEHDGTNNAKKVNVVASTTLPTSFSGNVTIDSGTITSITNPVAIKGNLTIASGTITAVTDITNPVAIKGNVTIDSIKAAWPDPKTYIGLVTVTGDMSTSFSGNITIDSIAAAWPDPKTFIGLVTAVGNFSTSFSGNVTIDSGTITTVTSITNPVAIKGNITINSGTVTAVTDITNPVALKGNLTIDSIKAGANYIGLMTVDVGNPGFHSLTTTTFKIVSASGNATALSPTAGKRLFLLDVHVASMGQSEVEIRSGATTLIPFTSLATQGGYVSNFGPDGLPFRAVNDALVVGLNGSTTVSVMAHLREA